MSSSNGMFCSVHDFVSKTLSLNVCYCYLKYARLQSTFSLALIRMVRILDIPKLSRNAKWHLMSQNFWGEECGETRKMENHMGTVWLLTCSQVLNMKKCIKYKCLN